MTSWIQPYYSEIALIILATLLVIYGDLLNKHIKRMVHSYHFLIRTLVFVLVCAFGYGLVVVYLSPYVKELILFIPYLYRGLSLFLLFLLLGYLAENRRYI
jgi:membrane protease YdiL (CAAX protease family)